MKNSKPLKKRLPDLLFWLLLVALIAFRAPVWFNAFKKEGTTVPSIPLESITQEKVLLFDPQKGNQALVFWASWCAPCKVELSRLASAVQEGRIPASKILAVSTDTDGAEYRRAVQERNYPFPTAWDSQGTAAHALGVEVTPTLVLVGADGKVSHMGTGLSLIGPWRVRIFTR